ncbi:phage neck terminator protein [Fusobacterium gastrosuis]|uniref:phage neck terminator protein n=1 Tax=Fusobacterium gastrosuis TaxID=1755100 RepID=UPI002970EC3C|nr:hypothetical protein [Fusobacteriaceae bacterium]MDY5712361.1 hypothetical protein [Fusobacterium gastrosuis]
MIKKIIELLNKVSAIQIISSYTEHTPPAKPYATYTVINVKTPDFFGATESEYIKNDDKYLEKAEYRSEAKIQFDVYTEEQENVVEKTTELKELILFILRYEFSRINAGIVKFTDIKMLREDISNKYEYRGSFDVTFEYMKLTAEKEVLIAREIELIANEQKKRIKGGKNGNI